jgi:hypothetical protein
MEFIGKALALSDPGLTSAAQSLGVEEAEIWTVLQVETSGCGFLPDRRPPILFERHIFHRLTQGRFDDGDISDATSGGYGPSGAPQYDRLARAMEKDRMAALKSASWGIGQVMGENYTAAGFAGVEAMVAALCDSEDAQVAAVAAFLKSRRIDAVLRSHDWRAFAAAYNGPSFAKNQYDTKLGTAYRRLAAGPLPDLKVRTVQLNLTFCGFDPGPVDGEFGARTGKALRAFQTREGLPATGAVDDVVLARLVAAASPTGSSTAAG